MTPKEFQHESQQSPQHELKMEARQTPEQAPQQASEPTSEQGFQKVPLLTPSQESQQEPDYFDLQKYAKWMKEEWIGPNWGAENRQVAVRVVRDLRRELSLAEKFKLLVVNQYLEQYWPKERDNHVLWMFRYVEAMVRYIRTGIRALEKISEKLEGRSRDAWEDLALCLTIGESVMCTAVKDINETVGAYHPPDLDRAHDPLRLHIIICGLEEIETAINKLCTKVSDMCYAILKRECLEE